MEDELFIVSGKIREKWESLRSELPWTLEFDDSFILKVIPQHSVVERDEIYDNLGIACLSMSKCNLALDAFDIGMSCCCDCERFVKLLHHKGLTYQAMNLLDRALNCWRDALQQSLSHQDQQLYIYYSISELYCEQKADISAMNILLNSVATNLQSSTAHSHYGYFAMHNVHHHMKNWAPSWTCLESAHAAQRLASAAQGYSQIASMASYRATVSVFGSSSFWPRDIGHDSELPLFIVGMMRCGSSLLEHILSAHRDIQAIGEDSVLNSMLPRARAEIMRALSSAPAAASSSPASARQVNIQQVIQLQGDIIIHKMKLRAQQMRSDDICNKARESTVPTRPHTGQNESTDHLYHSPKRIIDKMLFNYKNLGFIHLLFPNALILHLVRSPLDCLWSCFRHKFDDNSLKFAQKWDDLVFEYVVYLELMHHWRTVLPGRVRDVLYEDLVSDTSQVVEEVVQQMCHLEWDSSMLSSFHSRTDRVVHTNSQMQVRHPINKNSLSSWKPYTSWLRPLVPLLRSALQNLLARDKVDWKLQDLN